MKPLYTIDKQVVLNERIQKHLDSLPNAQSRNKYREILIDNKKHLLRLYNQCKQLNLAFDYKLDKALQNIDLIRLEELQSKLNANIKNARASEHPLLKLTKKQKKKAKNIKLKRKEDQEQKKTIEKWPKSKTRKINEQKKRPWVRIVFTPMYS